MQPRANPRADAAKSKLAALEGELARYDVLHRATLADGAFEQPPELVAGMRVIGPGGERGVARQAAEDEQPGNASLFDRFRHKAVRNSAQLQIEL